MSHVVCHVFSVTCQVSGVMCNIFFLFYNVVELVGGGSVINGTFPVYFLILLDFLEGEESKLVFVN